MDEGMKNTIEALKVQRDELRHELDEIGDETADGWENFKEKVQKQTKNFSESVKEFFNGEDD
jgi:hypothetical protein